MRGLSAGVAGVMIAMAVAGCVPDRKVPVPAPTSTAAPTTSSSVITLGPDTSEVLPTCAELGALPGLPTGAAAVPAPETKDNPVKCEWRGGDTGAQISVWEYAKPPLANASFTNMLMLCPGEEFDPVGVSDRSAWCARKIAPACNLIAIQGIFYIDVVWTAAAGTDESACRKHAAALSGQVSELLG
ncbi:hypothetical protein [Nocardia sp. NPDC050717]|uniref:hypothetical protein n=1 Tax=Nocardia sp. NPDC050717 TaxID=3157221 RepID=UPI0033E0B228